MGVAQFAAGQRVRALDLNQLPVVVSYLTTGSVSSSAAETIIGTFTIPAGDPTFPGGYWWKVFGNITETGSPSISLRMRLNTVTGSLLLTNTVASATAGGPWSMDGWLGFEAIGSSGTFGTYSMYAEGFSAGAAATAPGLADAIAINTTISNTIVVTAQFGTSSASNVATSKFGALYRL